MRVERSVAVNQRKRSFPLVTDDEVVISPARQMHLYNNEDLITNGGRDFYSIDTPIQDQPERVSPKLDEEVIQPKAKEQSYAEMAKQEARADLRRKRQAIVTVEKKVPSKLPDLPASPKKKEVPQGLTRYSDKLRQSSYILADLKPVYQAPTNKVDQESPQNSYDFLKRSQVYNHQENQRKKERQVAQELNLTRFEDLD